MLVVIISFPPIKEGRDAEFQGWFATSSAAFKNFDGFINRRLLDPTTSGNYAAIVEFRDQTAFQAMLSSPAHDIAGDQVIPLFDGKPTPTFYQVIEG